MAILLLLVYRFEVDAKYGAFYTGGQVEVRWFIRINTELQIFIKLNCLSTVKPLHYIFLNKGIIAKWGYEWCSLLDPLKLATQELVVSCAFWCIKTPGGEIITFTWLRVEFYLYVSIMYLQHYWSILILKMQNNVNTAYLSDSSIDFLHVILYSAVNTTFKLLLWNECVHLGTWTIWVIFKSSWLIIVSSQ